MRGNYSCRFPISSALPAAIAYFGTIQKKTPQVHDVSKSSKVGFLYLCLNGAAIAAPFLLHPHWAFFKRPIACLGTVP